MTDEIDFIGIGAARCGTSWIANVLRAHPDICISEPKEIRYFNQFEMPIGQQTGKKNKNFSNDIHWYMKRFVHARAGQIKGEISPIYLVDEGAPAAIREKMPNIKLLISLRNPVDRAISLYQLHRGNNVLPDISFEEAWEQEPVYFQTGLYAEQLKRYLGFFKKEQLHVVIFEELISDSLNVFQGIFRFLEVDVHPEIDFSRFHTNLSVNRRSGKLHSLAFRFSQFLVNNHMSGVLAMLRKMGAHSLVNQFNSADSNFGAVPQSQRDIMIQAYKDDIKALEEMTGKDLEIWCRT